MKLSKSTQCALIGVFFSIFAHNAFAELSTEELAAMPIWDCYIEPVDLSYLPPNNPYFNSFGNGARARQFVTLQNCWDIVVAFIAQIPTYTSHGYVVTPIVSSDQQYLRCRTDGPNFYLCEALLNVYKEHIFGPQYRNQHYRGGANAVYFDQQPAVIRLSPASGATESETLLTSTEPDQSTNLIARVYDQNNQLIPNVGVRLILEAKKDSGGHHHGDDTVTARTGTLAGQQVLTGNTGPSGLQFSYKAPSVSGDYKIKASCTDGKNCKQEGPDGVWVGVKYLYPATGSQNYVLISPNRDTYHPDNHYLTGAANTALEELAIRYHMEFPNSPVLYLNDSSLERGGLFDIAFNCDTYSGTCSRSKPWWTPPHSEHRRGVVIDIRANGTSTAIPPQNYGRFKAIANGLYMNVKDETDLGHFHVRLLGLAQ